MLDNYVYDIETYPNVFTITIIRERDEACWQYAITPWYSQLDELLEMINFLCDSQSPLVGFNNVGFDYPVVHTLIRQAYTNGITANLLYNRAMDIINAPHNDRFGQLVWESDWYIPQVDLFKIHHFDNQARSTSLKVLEFNMRSKNIEDLPFEVGVDLKQEDVPVLLEYNKHDVRETLKFLKETKPMIEFRQQLTEKYGKNFINFNDTKIGKEYFIMQLEKSNPGCCYKRIDGRRQVQQTHRDSIALGDLIFPYVGFQHSEFNRVLTWLRSQVIRETKGVFPDVNCTVDGFTYHFGTGGIHGSVESQHVKANDHYMIVDLDVTSYYPSLAISNRVYPEHLGEHFCDLCSSMKNERTGYAKGIPENAMLKLALNGVYGDSNNHYSPFYDPAYMLTITINGQLLLCMLAEMLINTIADCTMIQANTDGATVRIPRAEYDQLKKVWNMWELITGLQLEESLYRDMFIRDVNNYIAVYPDGSVKCKGAYQRHEDREWHQNHSNMIVPLAAYNYLVHGVEYKSFIKEHTDPFDFMARIKAPRSNRVMWGDEQIQNTSRYYVCTGGRAMTKVMPAMGPIGQFKKANGVSQHLYNVYHSEFGNTHNPDIHTKNKSTYQERVNDVESGFSVQVCNRMSDEFPSDINYDYYIAEVEKLVRPFQ